jgi:hypothetical protein
MSKAKRSQLTCRCLAYPFPHRKDSKECLTLRLDQEDRARQWDAMLDDPRYGQAAQLNRSH